MIKIKLGGRPTARFYLELNRAVDGVFEYLVDRDCVLHLWVAEAAGSSPSQGAARRRRARVREKEFRAAVQVHRTLCRGSTLAVAVIRTIRKLGLHQADTDSVRRCFYRYKNAINVLRSGSDMLLATA